jgi:hypothetical protein
VSNQLSAVSYRLSALGSQLFERLAPSSLFTSYVSLGMVIYLVKSPDRYWWDSFAVFGWCGRIFRHTYGVKWASCPFSCFFFLDFFLGFPVGYPSR